MTLQELRLTGKVIDAVNAVLPLNFDYEVGTDGHFVRITVTTAKNTEATFVMEADKVWLSSHEALCVDLRNMMGYLFEQEA